MDKWQGNFPNFEPFDLDLILLKKKFSRKAATIANDELRFFNTQKVW
ncbi:MAG: hypothetical protein MRK01_07520 [Candidatus Scalindua sp.]|nr:hypothetical protein [Candidatus Scalindua sp.]